MRVSIGADHAGYELKDKLKASLSLQGVTVTDAGTNGPESVDYPDYAAKVAHDVAKGKADFGVLVCGSGIGMAIAANKVDGIRAVNVSSEVAAQLSREHNNANVVTVGARLLSEEEAKRIVERFLHTDFAGGRHEQRVEKIARLENSSQ
jgi:ribose 5-phosphate isomerase B